MADNYRMDSVDEGPTWSEIAAWYDNLLSVGSGPHETAVACLRELIPELDGAAVLDLACGQGLATRALADAGARRVVGVDLSSAMVERARLHESPPGCDISYVVDDAQALSAFASATFDGVTCQLGLMDIPDLDAVLGAACRVLRPEGWFVFVLGHPCFLMPEATFIREVDGHPALSVSGYFREGFWRSSNPNGVRRAGNYHRTLSTYLNAIVRSGFRMDKISEPRPTPLLARQSPVYGEVPIFFGARVHRI
jgi:ubiquinone/menaquinone biosynthesis C-methylase UbiE